MIKNKIIIAISLSITCLVIIYSDAAEMQSWGYIPHYTSLTDKSISEAVNEYDIISASGFYITPSGSILREKTSYILSIIAECRKKGRIFYPMITFKNPTAGIKLLSSEKARINCAGSIKALISKNQFEGIHLDLEYIPPRYVHALQLLLKEIKKRAGNKKITFALYPQVDYNSPYRGFHDIPKISPYIDEAVVMCYDLHNRKTTPGPVTDLKWSEKNIAYLLKHLEPSRIWLGIPAYGYIWNNRISAKAVSAKHAAKLAERFGSSRSASGTLYIRYKKNGLNEAYVSDRHTRKEMIKLSERYRLAGWALWRVGFED
ncbi:MAG TPA: glycosyl hydrolase family 18 protein [Spirochaetota bacterium]|nr:glycosyl hydrolase family 18 protein [Spirochaetota bacterium]